LATWGVAKPAAKYPAQEKSMQDAAPDRRTYEKLANKKSSDGRLFVVLILSFGLVLVAEYAGNAGFKGFLQSGLNVLHFVVSYEVHTFFLRQLLALPGFVDPLHFDDLAIGGADRHEQLFHLS
jgi:hypothetical protein